MKQIERYHGCLLGLACGDALGTTLEFKPPGSFIPIVDMVDGGPFNLSAGQWTDDTSMALCLAESLINCQGFDPIDQMKRYLRWYREGYLSSTGRCFDIGNTISDALLRFEISTRPYSGSTDPYSAGNGSLMRLAPVPMFYAGDVNAAIEKAALSSRTTHGARTAIDACRYFGGLLVGALNGLQKEEILSLHFITSIINFVADPLTNEIQEIAEGSFKRRHPPDIKGTGYVVQSLESSLWAFYNTDSFQEGCLAAVNLGDDADTTGAIYGQLAGAYYGLNNIPESWLARITFRDKIYSLAEQLYKLSQLGVNPDPISDLTS
jgi:ADP-ribosyl-[dinitrogen reductase] hydrolase